MCAPPRRGVVSYQRTAFSRTLEFGHFGAPKGRLTPALGNAQGLRTQRFNSSPERADYESCR
jgi:hypothetical protein